MKRSSISVRGAALLALGLISSGVIGCGAARADEIRNPTATFAGLDKITGRIISFDVAVDETVQFGTLQITPRVCLTRPQTEAPLTEGFIEVDEVDAAKQAKRVFSGWMFAASPGLHGVEHPVYDVWLKDCKGGVEVVAAPSSGGDVNALPPPNATLAPKGAVPAKKAQRTITPQNPVEPTMESLPPATAGDLAAPPPAPAQDPSLGTPVEVGPPPGARAPDAAVDPTQPVAPPKPKVKKPKPKPAPVQPVDAAPPPPEPQHAPAPQQQPGFPNIFPKLF
jgi:hypothetical protein